MITSHPLKKIVTVLTLILICSTSFAQWVHMGDYFSDDPRSLEMGTNDGVVYKCGNAANSEELVVYTISVVDSSLSQLQATGDWVYDVAFSPDGMHAYAPDNIGIHIYDVNANGSLTEIAGSPYIEPSGNIKQVEFYDDNYLWFADDWHRVYRVQRTPGTGALGGVLETEGHGYTAGVSCVANFFWFITDMEYGNDGKLRISSRGVVTNGVTRMGVGANGVLTYEGDIRPLASVASTCGQSPIWNWGNATNIANPYATFTSSTGVYIACGNTNKIVKSNTLTSNTDAAFAGGASDWAYGVGGIINGGAITTPTGNDQIFWSTGANILIYDDGNTTPVQTLTPANMNNLTDAEHTSNGGLMFVASRTSDRIHVLKNSSVTPLSVNFSSFEVNRIEEGVNISWSTGSETNNSHFEVEKTLDGKNWGVIAHVSGAGYSSTPLNYKAFDDAYTIGIAYYRIKQVDFDGSYTYSTIESVNNNKPLNVTIYPNPAQNLFTIKGERLEEAQVIITNSLGKLIDIVPVSKLGSELTYNTSTLSRGMYFVSIYQNGVTENKKLMLTK